MTFNYYDFANETFDFLNEIYESGIRSNSMASQIQNTCERYLKHLIEEYDNPSNVNSQLFHNDILRTHSVNNLVRYLEDNMNVTFSNDTKLGLLSMDNLYFTTRYPGRDSRMANEVEIDEYMQYLRKFKTEYDEIVERLEEIEENIEI